jgi:hypothetical protein
MLLATTDSTTLSSVDYDVKTLKSLKRMKKLNSQSRKESSTAYQALNVLGSELISRGQRQRQNIHYAFFVTRRSITQRLQYKYAVSACQAVS